jgi:transcriptional regulator with XRE-family HTH domain
MATGIAYEHSTPGARIRRLRTNAKMVQRELADRVDMSRPLIASWESGGCTPRLDEFKSLARALNTTPEYLAFGSVG